MDHLSCREREFDIDLESGIAVSDQNLNKESVSNVKVNAKALLSKVCGGLVVDGENKGDNELSTSDSDPNLNGLPVESLEAGTGKTGRTKNMNTEEKKSMKDKRKKSNKKYPKPPRPPKGPSLDAADQKLIREIAQLAMLKRARNERRKALRKMKADGSSSSIGNILAVAFTVLFFLVVIFQGLSPSNSASSFQESPTSVAPADMGLVSVQDYTNPSASIPNGPGNASPSLIEQVAALDHSQDLRRDD